MSNTEVLDTTISPRGLGAANQRRAERQGVRALIAGVGFNFGGKRRGTCNVRATSKLAGDAELRKWRNQNVFSRVEKEVKLEQIFAWADEHKAKGKPWGLLTPKDKVILQVMHDARCYTTGRLDFAYSQLCTMARCCAQTLSVAIKKFERLGLLEKWRRMVPIADPETGGSRNTQINNAYFLRLPTEVAKRVAAVLAKLSTIVLPAVPKSREPTEHEVRAVAATRAKAQSADLGKAGRNEHYANSMIETMNARRNNVSSS